MNSSLVTRHSSLGKENPQSGFTLLEMLVVIVVMALLMGVTFRMLKPSEHARSIAATLKTINLANAAIAEYHAEYGIYPPVLESLEDDDGDTIEYDVIQHSIRDVSLTGGLVVEGDTKNKCGFVPGVSVAYFTPTSRSRTYFRQLKKRGDYDKTGPFTLGLAAYLVDRRDPELKGDKGYNGKSYLDDIFAGASNPEKEKFFGDGSHWALCGRGYTGTSDTLYEDLAPSAKDVAFYKRIRSITSQIVKEKGFFSEKNRDLNYHYYTIRDSFTTDGRDLIYICPAPYTSYALFSAGPDGKVVTNDPLNPDAECPTCHQYHNRDNVYSTVNIK